MSGRNAFVVGVGLTKFSKPNSRKWDYPDIGREAAENALKDAGVNYNQVDAVVVSHVYGESTSGQKAVYELGLTGIPVFNTNNNCSSASCALMLSRLLILSGEYNCVLALGFEKMDRGLTTKWDDRINPSQKHFDRLGAFNVPPESVTPALSNFTSDVLKIYAYGAREHSSKYGTTKEQYAKIAYKNHYHSQHNPNASLQKVIPMADIMKKEICSPITLFMCSMTADGGAAAVVCNEKFLLEHSLQNKAVEILAQQMKTDLPSSFDSNLQNVGGYDMAKQAAEYCYRRSGYTAKDVDVLEVHDCFSCNELFMYEALGLCAEGQGGKLVDEGQWITNKAGGHLFQVGNRWVVNPDGGLESKGHPIGATGLAQCAEIVYQLRGEAGKRQVEGARIGLQHNFGIGGAAVVTMYKKYRPVSSRL
ncbi:sterol carrier protein 2-like isoform X1 [Hydractinia symbiolongicarpus]|uniref:sterol carrier protein 2-like isoform X1 n=1 Tax=Hydractinia symbiolongicarpus TaxID=13093 RepID=UPI00254DE038|nr:sterol carrier protein 2-like isoform X1 [Hydractinia symbiolongicarpus]